MASSDERPFEDITHHHTTKGLVIQSEVKEDSGLGWHAECCRMVEVERFEKCERDETDLLPFVASRLHTSPR
jgi:hypothetical protein